jgi:PadR family transcriptional regulator PadR
MTDAGFAPGLLRDTGLPPKNAPKNYLLAWILVMLRDHNLHGYEIMKELKEKFNVVNDPATVYRALRQLERDGYISSWWDSKEQGASRRIYAITDAGCTVLRAWSIALEAYRSSIDAFLSVYASKLGVLLSNHKLA